MILYFRIHQLLLENSLRQQNASEKEINEIFGFLRGVGPSKGKLSTATAGGVGGTSGGLLKRVWGGKDDFIHNYNIQIDRSNALRRSRGQPTLKYWGGKETWDKPKVETTPDKTPDTSIETKPEVDPFAPRKPKPRPIKATPEQQIRNAADTARRKTKNAATHAANRAAGLARQKLFHQGRVSSDDTGGMGTIGARQQRDALSGVENYGKLLQTPGGRNQAREIQTQQVTDPLQSLKARLKRKKQIGLSASTYYGDVANLIRESFLFEEDAPKPKTPKQKPKTPKPKLDWMQNLIGDLYQPERTKRVKVTYPDNPPKK